MIGIGFMELLILLGIIGVPVIVLIVVLSKKKSG